MKARTQKCVRAFGVRMIEKQASSGHLLTCRKEGTVIPMEGTALPDQALDNRQGTAVIRNYHREHTIFFQKMQQLFFVFLNTELVHINSGKKACDRNCGICISKFPEILQSAGDGTVENRKSMC